MFEVRRPECSKHKRTVLPTKLQLVVLRAVSQRQLRFTVATCKCPVYGTHHVSWAACQANESCCRCSAVCQACYTVVTVANGCRSNSLHAE